LTVRRERSNPSALDSFSYGTERAMSRGAAERRFALANRVVLWLGDGWHNCCIADVQGRFARGVRRLPVTLAARAASHSRVTRQGLLRPRFISPTFEPFALP
jgi:hypothetical protein